MERLITRPGCPEAIYSDNGKTYVAPSRWIKRISKSEILPGKFERMVSQVKNTLYKTVGKSNLEWKELEETLIYIEL